MAAHRYWRVLVLNITPAFYIGCSEVEFRITASGADQTGSGTPISSSDYGGSYVKGNAFDNNNSTDWYAAGFATGPAAIGYDFGAGSEKDIVEISWRTNSSSAVTRMENFDLQYSDDGTTWVTLAYFRNQTALTSNGQTAVYNIANASTVFDAAPHCLSALTFAPYVLTRSTAISAAWEAYKAFGAQNSSTEAWSSTEGTSGGWIQIDFGAGNELYLTDYSLLNNHATTNRCPKNWTLQGSNNGTDFDTLDTRTNETGWSNPQTRNYVIGSPGTYQIYRLAITANNGDTSYTVLGELYLFAEITAGPSTYDESLTLAISGGMARTIIAEVVNALTLSLSVAQDQTGGMTFEEAVTLAVQASKARAANVEMNAGLSLGISAEQGTGSTAEMDAVIALSLAMAMLQAGSVDAGAQTYEEAATLAAAMGMSHTAIGTLQEAVTLATAAGMGLSGQSVLINALVLQATASMIQSAVGSLSASLNLDVSMSEAFGTALILQASVLLGAAGGLSASGGMSLDDAATLGINAGMAQTVGYLLTAAVELSVQASQAQAATMTAEAQLALSIACSKIDSMGRDVDVSLALSIVAGMQQWGIVPRIAAARHLYKALARKREYDAKERKLEYDATARKREYDDE